MSPTRSQCINTDLQNLLSFKATEAQCLPDKYFIFCYKITAYFVYFLWIIFVSIFRI